MEEILKCTTNHLEVESNHWNFCSEEIKYTAAHSFFFLFLFFGGNLNFCDFLFSS